MADYDRLCVLMDSCKRVGYVRESAMLNGVLCESARSIAMRQRANGAS